jgi:hypothetical protein
MSDLSHLNAIDSRLAHERAPLYASVVLMNGARVYSRFSSDLARMLVEVEHNPGWVAIEQAHAGKPPVWERAAEESGAVLALLHIGLLAS